MAHDAQMAAAGVTTVYDAVCAGYDTGETSPRRDLFEKLIGAITTGVRNDLWRARSPISIVTVIPTCMRNSGFT